MCAPFSTGAKWFAVPISLPVPTYLEITLFLGMLEAYMCWIEYVHIGFWMSRH